VFAKCFFVIGWTFVLLDFVPSSFVFSFPCHFLFLYFFILVFSSSFVSQLKLKCTDTHIHTLAFKFPFFLVLLDLVCLPQGCVQISDLYVCITVLYHLSLAYHSQLVDSLLKCLKNEFWTSGEEGSHDALPNFFNFLYTYTHNYTHYLSD